MLRIDRNLQLAAEGDMKAFEEIYRRYQRQVYGQCLRMTRSFAEAEDLTQEVFIQVLRKLNTFRGESSFSTWLHRLAVNAVLMHFRKPVVRLEATTEDGTTPTEIVRGTQYPNRMSILDSISLNEALRQLAPGYRAVFILHDVEGYEHEEIGKILGCAAGTSKSQLHKARLKLRDLLLKHTSVKKNNAACRQSVNLKQLCEVIPTTC
jgi:RNA polymerase sigma-70 factor, ECF subfamily